MHILVKLSNETMAINDFFPNRQTLTHYND